MPFLKMKRPKLSFRQWWRNLWRADPKINTLPQSDVLTKRDMLFLMHLAYDRLEPQVSTENHALQMFDLISDPRVLILLEESYKIGFKEAKYNPDRFLYDE